MVATHRRDVATKGQGDAHDITDLVASAVAESACAAGIVTIFVVGSTAAVTTIEFEPGAVADLNRGPADYESAALPTELRRHGRQTRMVPRPRPTLL